MLYTPSHAELGQHPKTRKLARLLGVSIPTAIGHLNLLWHFALKYAADGDLARFDNDEIADGCLWEGDPSDLYDGFRGAGWIDPDATLHDWAEYGGKYINRKEANAQRMREARATNKQDTKKPRATHVQRTSATRVEPEERRGEETREDKSSLRSALNGDAPLIDLTRRNEVWDALVEGTGITPSTANERSRFGKSVAELLALDATRSEILRRCQHYAQHYPNTTLTDLALVNNWSTVGVPPRAGPRQADMNSGKRGKFVQ